MSNSRSLSELSADHLSVLDDAIRSLGRSAAAKVVDQDWALGTITWRKSLGHPNGNPIDAFGLRAGHIQEVFDALPNPHYLHLLVPHIPKIWDATKPEDDHVHLDFIIPNVVNDEGRPKRLVYAVEVTMLPGDWRGDPQPALRRLWPPSHAFMKGADPVWIPPFTVAHIKEQP